jgi:hypothetical protein
MIEIVRILIFDFLDFGRSFKFASSGYRFTHVGRTENKRKIKFVDSE